MCHGTGPKPARWFLDNSIYELCTLKNWRPNNNTIWLLYIILYIIINYSKLGCHNMIIWFLVVLEIHYHHHLFTDFYSMGGPHKSPTVTWPPEVTDSQPGQQKGRLKQVESLTTGICMKNKNLFLIICDILWQSVIFCDILWYFEAGLWIEKSLFKKWCGAAVACPWEVSASAKEGLADFFSDWFGSLRLHHKERLRNSVKSFEGSTLWSHLARLQARKHV